MAWQCHLNCLAADRRMPEANPLFATQQLVHESLEDGPRTTACMQSQKNSIEDRRPH
jgi:hypothetical protein